MNIFAMLHKKLGNPLDWPSSKKASFLLQIHFLEQCLYLFSIYFLLNSPELSRHLNIEFSLLHLSFFKAIVMSTLGVIIIVKLLQHYWHESSAFEHIAAQIFAISQVYYGYCIGLMSLPTGVVLAGVPVVGFIFFHRRAVVYSVISSTIAIFAFSYATLIDLIPYAPLAHNITNPEGQLDPVWALIYCFFTLPHLILILFLSYYSLQRWRQREAEIHFMSSTDPLTGILNRRSILNHLILEHENSTRAGTPLSVLMIDLDHFKMINDTWGHSTGDEALIKAAATLSMVVRQNDFLGRYGGEEFLIILPGLEHDQAHHLAERIRIALSDTNIELEAGTPIKITASMGLCCADPDMNLTYEQLIHEADKALYRAKNSGRNRLVVS